MATADDKAKIKEAAERKKRELYEPVKPDMQLGFIHNNVDCIGCRACEMACKDKNGLPPRITVATSILLQVPENTICWQFQIFQCIGD